MIKNESLVKFPHNHLLGIEGLTPPDLNYLLDLSDHFAKRLDEKNTDKLNYLKNKICINLFFENSTRTRTSFELAGKKLGADMLNISVASSAIKKAKP